MPFIHIQGLEHSYPLEQAGRQVQALRGIDLTIQRGEFVALVGANGSGKSTLAYHLNGLLLPTRGEVWVDGMLTADPRHLWAIRRRVGMVFQNPDNQLVASTVEEDVAFGPENYGLATAEIRQRVDEALDVVGLGQVRTRPPQTLSGGQKQLVAIAGALATADTPDRACIVFDEPTSMLDPASRRHVLSTIWQLNKRQGLTIVLITQSMEEAASAQRVLVMDQGRLAIDGTPQKVFARGCTVSAGGSLPAGCSSSAREQMQALGLGVPPAVEIAHHLWHLGLELPLDLLTVEALAAALIGQRRSDEC
jgi:energy-coupling factor transport system ATP-binding protein